MYIHIIDCSFLYVFIKKFIWETKIHTLFFIFFCKKNNTKNIFLIWLNYIYSNFHVYNTKYIKGLYQNGNN